MKEQVSAPAGGTAGSYEQELSRTLALKENVFITLSAVTPASSVFIIVPAVVQGVGGASVIAFVIAALVGIAVAACYAELSSAFPIAGGEYAFVARTIGRSTGFALFLMNLVTGVLILGVIASGVGEYLGYVWSGLSGRWVGVAVILLTGLVALLGIRTNAWVTGVFLVLELAALAVLAVLGFANVTQPISTLWTPQAAGPDGTLTAVSAGLVVAYTSTAIFAYNGYGTAVYYAEETHRASATIGRAIMWSLGITVTAEVVPLTAVLLGTPSMQGLVTAASPMVYFLQERGGGVVTTLVSLGIVIAIVNAVIAIMLQVARGLYSSARDRSWPDAVGRPLAMVHPRLRTPTAATVVVTVVAAVVLWFVPFELLLLGTASTLVVLYFLVGLAALVGRARGRTGHAAFRMRAWPVAPIVLLVVMVVVAFQNLLANWVPVAVALGIFAAGYVYYYAYIHPRRGDRWTLPDPVSDDAS